MVLQSIVDQVLSVLGEHHTVDLATCTGFNKLDALVDLRES
jgi:hypothetical protein